MSTQAKRNLFFVFVLALFAIWFATIRPAPVSAQNHVRAKIAGFAVSEDPITGALQFFVITEDGRIYARDFANGGTRYDLGTFWTQDLESKMSSPEYEAQVRKLAEETGGVGH